MLRYGLILGWVLSTCVAYADQGDGLYFPGQVRAMSDDSLAPPAQDPSSPAFWRVDAATRLHHFAQGDGEPILVIHGGPGYPPAEPWLAGSRLSRRHRLHYYHQRGCGLSTRPVDRMDGVPFGPGLVTVEAKLGLGQQIADIERIRRLLGREKLVLIGHSFGALLAALYAAEFPEHVERLVLVAPADLVVAPGSDDANLFAQVGQRLPESLRPEYGEYLRQYFDFPSLYRKSDRELSDFYGHFAKFYEAATGALPHPVTGGAPGGWMPLAAYLSLGRRHDYSAALGRVGVPVLVVHGDRDLTPPSVTGHFAGYFPGAKLVRLPGAGHFPFDETPEAFAEIVAEFVDR